MGLGVLPNLHIPLLLRVPRANVLAGRMSSWSNIKAQNVVPVHGAILRQTRILIEWAVLINLGML
jgi:hypothetical protein